MCCSFREMGMAGSRYRNGVGGCTKAEKFGRWLYLAAPTSEWGHWFVSNAKALANKEKKTEAFRDGLVNLREGGIAESYYLEHKTHNSSNNQDTSN